MILRHLAVCFGVEIDGINIDILKVLVWGAASPVSIGIYCDCFGSVSIGSIYGIFWSVLNAGGGRAATREREPTGFGVRCLQPDHRTQGCGCYFVYVHKRRILQL